jgi:hypothetical protein
VWHLGAAADPRLLELDEVADLRPRPDLGKRAQMTEGAELRTLLHRRLREDAVGLEEHAGAEAARRDVAAGADHALGADGGHALQHHAGVEHGIGADHDGVVHVGRAGVQHGHAVCHQAVQDAAAMDGSELGELLPVVDAQTLARIRGHHRLEAPAVVAEDADDVGEVVLALLVLRRHSVQRGPEGGGVEAVDAGADLVDLALRGRGVAMLDDGGGPAVLADHAPVAGGIVDARGKERGGGPGRGVVLDEPAQHRLRHQQLVARDDEDGPGRVPTRPARLQHRVPGAPPLRLLDVDQVGRVTHGRLDLVGGAPDHQYDLAA